MPEPIFPKSEAPVEPAQEDNKVVAPEPEAGSEQEETTSEAPVDELFGHLANLGDDEEVVDDDAPPQEETPPEPAADPTPTPATPAAPAAPPVAAEPKQEPEPTPTPPVQAAPTQEPPPQESWTEFRGRLGKDLAEHYKKALTPADGEEDVDLSERLPALAAEIHTSVFESILPALLQRVPGIVQMVQKTQTQEAKFRSNFAEAYPEIPFDKHEPVLLQIGAFVRQQFPTISEAEFIQKLGETAMVQLGIARQEAPPPAPPPAPVHRPAGVGAATTTRIASGEDDNEFGRLATLEEDDT